MECFSCDYEGTRRGLGSHYGGSPDHRPKLSDKQHEIIAGLLMGDGHINRSNKTPKLRAEMINDDYLEYLDNIFGHVSLGVKKSRTAAEQSAYHRKTGFNNDASADTYSDCYWWETMCHQEFEQYADWYESGSKVFPEDIELTPTTLKHWYVCDGNLSPDRQLRLFLDNERKNKIKIEQYFHNLPEFRWDEQSKYTAIIFGVAETEELLEYMGEPLPGFGYKWVNQKT